MAIILRGKLKDKKVNIMQFANDWIMIDVEPPAKTIMSPTSLGYSLDEINRMKSDKHIGYFWSFYAVTHDPATGYFRLTKKLNRRV